MSDALRAVDLFAGAGGFTEAASRAGLQVLWAANHWQAAVDVHRLNHPETEHVCQDLHQANWSRVPEMDVVLASPSCQGHARARGRERPHHDLARSTAWAVVNCAEYHRPALLIVENVPEFLRWELYPTWQQALQRLGYDVTTQIIDAADCGVPQNRKRVFIVGSKHGPISIPQPSSPHRPAIEIIAWDAGTWSPVNRPGRAATTLARWRLGRREFGRRFALSYYGNSHRGRSLDRPIGTITTRDRWALIDGDRMRMLRPDECRKAMAFPRTYRLPPNSRLAVHMLGNAVPPPMGEHVIRAAISQLRGERERQAA